MKLVDLGSKRRDTKEALQVIDDLRAAVESGKIIAFAAVGIEPDDVTCGWSACTQPVTRLRMLGAIASLSNSTHNDPDFYA